MRQLPISFRIKTVEFIGVIMFVIDNELIYICCNEIVVWYKLPVLDVNHLLQIHSFNSRTKCCSIFCLSQSPIAKQKTNNKHKTQKSSIKNTLMYRNRATRYQRFCFSSLFPSVFFVNSCGGFVCVSEFSKLLLWQMKLRLSQRERSNVCTENAIVYSYVVLVFVVEKKIGKKNKRNCVAAAQPLTQTTTHQLNSVWFLYDDFNFDIALLRIIHIFGVPDVVVAIIAVLISIVVVVIACSALYASFIALMLCGGDLGSGSSHSSLFHSCAPSSSPFSVSLARLLAHSAEFFLHSFNCVS